MACYLTAFTAHKADVLDACVDTRSLRRLVSEVKHRQKSVLKLRAPFCLITTHFEVNTHRLIYRLRSRDHITDALISLHWLRVPERIQYKLAVLTYNVLRGGAPSYLGPLVRVADLPGRRALRSVGSI